MVLIASEDGAASTNSVGRCTIRWGGYFINYNSLAGFSLINYVSLILVSVDWLTLAQFESISVSVLVRDGELRLLHKCICETVFTSKAAQNCKNQQKSALKSV